MKTHVNIHMSSVERLYNDGLITDNEYKKIMDRIVSEKVKEGAKARNG